MTNPTANIVTTELTSIIDVSSLENNIFEGHFVVHVVSGSLVTHDRLDDTMQLFYLKDIITLAYIHVYFD